MKWLRKPKPELPDNANIERIEELAAKIKVLADEIATAAAQARQLRRTVR